MASRSQKGFYSWRDVLNVPSQDWYTEQEHLKALLSNRHVLSVRQNVLWMNSDSTQQALDGTPWDILHTNLFWDFSRNLEQSSRTLIIFSPKTCLLQVIAVGVVLQKQCRPRHHKWLHTPYSATHHRAVFVLLLFRGRLTTGNPTKSYPRPRRKIRTKRRKSSSSSSRRRRCE